MKLLLHLGKPESVLLGHGQHLWIQNQLTPIPFEARIFHISTRGGTVQDLIQANHMEATWLDLSARILSQWWACKLSQMHFKPHTELRVLAVSTRLCSGTGDAVWEKSGAEREREIKSMWKSLVTRGGGNSSPPRLRIRGRACMRKASGYADVRAGGTMQMTHKMSWCCREQGCCWALT